jgi:hypothetical protein
MLSIREAVSQSQEAADRFRRTEQSEAKDKIEELLDRLPDMIVSAGESGRSYVEISNHPRPVILGLANKLQYERCLTVDEISVNGKYSLGLSITF